jgi:hypothetical protein
MNVSQKILYKKTRLFNLVPQNLLVHCFWITWLYYRWWILSVSPWRLPPWRHVCHFRVVQVVRLLHNMWERVWIKSEKVLQSVIYIMKKFLTNKIINLFQLEVQNICSVTIMIISRNSRWLWSRSKRRQVCPIDQKSN